jgi:Rrf2 family protein
MWSATAEYAVRAVLILAQSATPKTADAIANAIGAPPNYMAKTLNALAREGILKSARGPLGGFSLDMPSGQLMLDRIINVFHEPRPTAQCLLGNRACDPANLCKAHERWLGITQSTRHALATTSIASLLQPLNT